MRFFSVLFQFSDFALAQVCEFPLNKGNSLFGLVDLSDKAHQFGTDPFAGFFGAKFVFVENSAKSFDVSSLISAVCVSHYLRSTLTVNRVRCEIGVDAPSHFAKQAFQFG